MSIPCKLGFHRWGKSHVKFHFESNVKDYEVRCLRCGKIKRWNEPVE